MSLLAGRFRLEEEIGSGGMSRVFVGTDEVLGRTVAVKVLRSGFDDSDIGIRFRREGRTSARLSHPNVVQVYDAGEAELDGREVSYIVMEYVPGGDLKQLVDREGPLGDGELARIGAEVASALDHAHGRGVIHRDIKPHNVLMDATRRAKLTDFGIARALDSAQATRTGSYLGTALYSSPEQLRGEKVGPESDVYALGATLYQAATGTPPFEGLPVELATQHASREPQPPSERGSAIGERLEALILACLAKAPEDRPTADEVRRRLEEVGREIRASDTTVPAAADRPTATSPTAGAVRPAAGGTRRRAGGSGRPYGRIPAALAALVLLVAIGVAGASALGGLPFSAGAPEEGQTPREPAPASPPEEPEEQAAEEVAVEDAGSGDSRPEEQPDAGASPGANQGRPEPEASPPEPGVQPLSQASGGASAAGASAEAEGAVREVYETAAAGDYSASYALLSEGFRQRNAPTQAQWSGQFETLEAVSFEGEPTVSVSGDTATVSGVTIARHTDRTERNTATWTLVREGGEWRLDDLNILEQTYV